MKNSRHANTSTGSSPTSKPRKSRKGLSEDVVRLISAKKNEPEWLLEWRLKAFRVWQKMKEPTWHNVKYNPIDYQDIIYYSAPKQKPSLKSLDEVDPEIRKTFDKLGIPLDEQKLFSGVAVDAVFDSVSVATTFKAKLAEVGIIFCSFSEAVQHHPDLVKKYLGSVVPHTDNFFAALNSAVFSDGSFAYIPKGVRCPMELSTYFRINAKGSGQFERTLIVAEEGSYVSYLEGCTAPMRDENQLHAAVVELVALDNATIKYSTIQNWYPGDKEGKGGIYNFVTKRGACIGVNSKITWTQVETGSAITWKYPSCILQGDNSIGEFYSVATTNNMQQADTGTKMIHLGKNTRSTIVSKGISAGRGQNTYRGQVRIAKKAAGARNYSQCDSLLIGDKCGAHTFPYLEIGNTTREGGARSVHVENRRGPDFLLPPARPLGRGRGQHHRQRLLQGRLPRAADGVRGGSAEAAEREPGRVGRIRSRTHARDQESSSPRRRQGDPARHQPHGQARAKSTPSWGRTAPARARSRACSRAIRNTKSPAARSPTTARTCWSWRPKTAPAKASSWRSSIPVEIPGVNNAYFLKAALNAKRKHQGLPELDAMEFMALVREKAKILHLDPTLLNRPVNEGFSGGEKKRNEIFQMAVLEPKLAVLDETDSGLDIDALKTVAEGVNAMRSPDRAIIVVTHYQRLLNYIVPDFVHVLQDGRIVRSGGKELALHLEEKGYSWIEAEPQLM